METGFPGPDKGLPMGPQPCSHRGGPWGQSPCPPPTLCQRHQGRPRRIPSRHRQAAGLGAGGGGRGAGAGSEEKVRSGRGLCVVEPGTTCLSRAPWEVATGATPGLTTVPITEPTACSRW